MRSLRSFLHSARGATAGGRTFRGATTGPSETTGLRGLASEVGRDWVEAEYYDQAEGLIDEQWEAYVAPFIEGVDFTMTVDLAAGHGRNSVKLAPLCRHLYVVDINASNVEYCRRRFVDAGNVSCHLNDGYSLVFLEDSSVSFVYCFDAMVHFDSDVVRSYLAETRRVLRPGGMGFFHHSNYTLGPAGDYHDNPGWRNFMSAPLFEHYAAKEGLVTVKQRVVDWDAPAADCFSLVERAK